MKIHLLIIFMFTSFLLNAQIKKGALFIGGDVSVYGSEFKAADANQYTRNVTSYFFSPSVGWAVKDNVIFGGSLQASFSNDKEENPGGYQSKGSRFGAGVWLRNYFPLGKTVFFFTGISLSGQSVYLNQTAQVQPGSLYKEKGFALSAALYPGLAYQVKKSLFIEASLNNLLSMQYERKNTEQGNSGSYFKGVSNSYSLSSSLGSGVPLQVGVRWIIEKK